MDDWYFGGMHWIWWGLWIILIFFGYPNSLPHPGTETEKG